MKRAAVFTLICLMAVAGAVAQTAAPKAQSRFATLDGVKVHYDNYGGGKQAIVLIHGWTCDATFWQANIPALAAAMRVIAVDLPGHGQSDKPEKFTYSMDAFANAVNAVLTHAKVERAVLVGHSMGVPVVRQFYKSYPAKTLGLVLVDGSLWPMGTKESMKQFFEPLRQPDYLKSMENSVNFLTGGMKDNVIAERVKKTMLSAPQHVIVGAFEGMLEPAMWKEPVKFKVPVLATMAANPMWTKDYEKFVRETAPGIDYQIWLGVSHFLMMDEPNKFNGTVATFLKRSKIIP
jgi:pimeloyl-ACP methyl ester carboxylesterase